MRAEIRRRKAELAAEAVAFDDRAEHRYSRPSSRAACARSPVSTAARISGAADDFAIDLHRRHADFVEAELIAQALQQREIAGAIPSETPFVSDADFAQRSARRRASAGRNPPAESRRIRR